MRHRDGDASIRDGGDDGVVAGCGVTRGPESCPNSMWRGANDIGVCATPLSVRLTDVKSRSDPS